jgi:hypothetical protein
LVRHTEVAYSAQKNDINRAEYELQQRRINYVSQSN